MHVRTGTFWRRLISAAGAVLLATSAGTRAQNSLAQNLWDALQGRVPHETALGFYAGRAYDWSDLYFYMASWQALFDYEALWPHKAPEGLGIRFEGNAGAATGTEFSGARLITSGNLLAVYEFGSPKSACVVPYVEAGIGVIYTDFQREGQGSRINFNPVAGVGLRMGSTFIVLRAHHLSNGGLNEHNRGINSVVLGFGMYL